LNPKGTDFQKRVWKTLETIPYGKTVSYLEISKILGDVKAIRAVAAANGKNPLWIIVPCHRVIGSDGSLTGYAGGLHRKKWLLDHENPVKQQSLF
ncbi:MAG TPA: methylated-DNA--[protein]-cysteine S-methyltransferase, partial [Pricia sp.]|nr:methylated-DNA--[protein]-cysteine S-methyltransferase [Pricia sp.]